MVSEEIQNSRTQVNQAVNLNLPNGDSLAVHVKEVKIGGGQSPLVEVLLTVDGDTYKKIDFHYTFGLQPENRGEILGGTFEVGKDFEIALRLRDRHVATALDGGRSAEDLKAALLIEGHEPISDLLRAADNWLALNVSQQMELPEHLQGKGSVKFGYTTKWADGGDPDHQTTTLSAQLINFFDAHKVLYNKQENQDIYQIKIVYPDMQWDMMIHVFEPRLEIMLLCMYPEDIPENHRHAIMSYITMANYGLVNGNFALNLDNGNLHFKRTGQFVRPSFDDFLGLLIQEASETYAKYAPGVAEVIGGESVQDVLRTAESV